MEINKKKSIILILVIFLFCLFFFKMLPFSSDSAVLKKAVTPTLVTITTVKKDSVDTTINALGTTLASEAVTLSTNVTEKVESLHFKDGDFVKKGQVIVALSSNEEQAKLTQAKATLLNAKKHFNRIAKLNNKKHISDAELDNAKVNYETAKAQVAENKSMIADRKILAPFSGYLGLRNISLGALIEPGTVIATLDKIMPIKCDFTIPEKYLGLIKVGQRIRASSVAYPGKKFIGKITAVSARVDRDTRTVTIRAIFSNKKELLKPGLLLHLNIIVKSRNELTIPAHALVIRDGQETVFILSSDNTVHQKIIETGQHVNDSVVVKKGLLVGDKIVVDGGFKLIDSQSVLVKAKDSK